MATTAALQHTPTDPKANVSMSDMPPTGFYPQGSPPHTGNGAVISNSQVIGMHLIQPAPSGTTVLVTQPVVTIVEPPVTCAIVWATLSSIFCCCICGITGILIAWKARLYVVQKKYEEARHSLSFVWLFFGLAIFFGLVTWIVVVLYCLLILPGQIRATADSYHVYTSGNYRP